MQLNEEYGHFRNSEIVRAPCYKPRSAATAVVKIKAASKHFGLSCLALLCLALQLFTWMKPFYPYMSAAILILKVCNFFCCSLFLFFYYSLCSKQKSKIVLSLKLFTSEILVRVPSGGSYMNNTLYLPKGVVHLFIVLNFKQMGENSSFQSM